MQIEMIKDSGDMKKGKVYSVSPLVADNLISEKSAKYADQEVIVEVPKEKKKAK